MAAGLLLPNELQRLGSGVHHIEALCVLHVRPWGFGGFRGVEGLGVESLGRFITKTLNHYGLGFGGLGVVGMQKLPAETSTHQHGPTTPHTNTHTHTHTHTDAGENPAFSEITGATYQAGISHSTDRGSPSSQS